MKLPKINQDLLVGRDASGIVKVGRITRTGKVMDIVNPDPATIDIESIAAGLAYQGRFTGQTRLYYDIARHSILVSLLVPKHIALKALLHDADEAFINDIARPVKPLLKDYSALQKKMLGAILETFGFSLPLEAEIKQADQAAVAIEQALLMPATEFWPPILPQQTVQALLKAFSIPVGFFLASNPEVSRIDFLRRFNKLKAMS